MAQIKDEMLKFLSSEDIAKLISKLAAQIESDYEGREIIFVCPLRGSIHTTADLARKVNLPQQIDFVYLQATEKGGAIRMMTLGVAEGPDLAQASAPANSRLAISGNTTA